MNSNIYFTQKKFAVQRLLTTLFFKSFFSRLLNSVTVHSKKIISDGL